MNNIYLNHNQPQHYRPQQQQQQQLLHQQPQQQHTPQQLSIQQQQRQQQTQQQQPNLINFINNSGIEIFCDSPSTDEYGINNLIEGGKGFLAESFVKPPIDITISLPYPIDLERIGVYSKVGSCISQSMSFYISEYSMSELIQNSNSTNKTGRSLSQSSGGLFPSSSHNSLNVNNTDLSVERYPGSSSTSSLRNSSNNGSSSNNSGSSNLFLNPTVSNSSSSSSSSPFSTSPSSRSMLSQSLSSVNPFQQHHQHNQQQHHHSGYVPQNSKVAQQKYIHEQFKFIGTFDDFHIQDSYFKYICGNSGNGDGNNIPNEISSKIYDPAIQIKAFHSNKHLLCKVKSIRIRILKVFNSSCAALGGIELWGSPSQSCSSEVIQFIYNDNSNNLKNGFKLSTSLFQQYKQQLLLNQRPILQIQQSQTQSHQQQQSQPTVGLFNDTDWLTQTMNNKPINQAVVNNGGFNIPSLPSVMNNTTTTSISSSTDEIMSDGSMEDINEMIDIDEDFKRDNPEIVFNEAGIPTTFLDPITCEIMSDPVILPSGYIVDKSTIEKHFQNQYFTDPFSGKPLQRTDILAHYVLCQKIQSYINGGKRKRLLKSTSSIFRKQHLMGMFPQISQSLSLSTTQNIDQPINNYDNNSNINAYQFVNNNNRNNPINIDEDDKMSISTPPTRKTLPKPPPPLLKLVSQDSFIDLPAKKHRVYDVDDD